jgi:hypothetical protein
MSADVGITDPVEVEARIQALKRHREALSADVRLTADDISAVLETVPPPEKEKPKHGPDLSGMDAGPLAHPEPRRIHEVAGAKPTPPEPRPRKPPARPDPPAPPFADYTALFALLDVFDAMPANVQRRLVAYLEHRLRINRG